MDDQFSQKIKALSELDFPPGLHGKIMRKLAFLQFRTPFLVVVSLLLLNLIFSGWQIWYRLSESDAFNTFRILLEGAEWNWRTLGDLFEIAQNLFPLGLIFTFTINILLIAYILFVLKTYKTLLLKQKQ